MIQNLLLPLLLQIRPFRLARVLARAVGIRRRPTRLPAGFSLHLDPMTILGREFARGHTYEPELTRFVRAILRSGDTFVDVGANEGYFSILAATAAPSLTVHSFEPNPATAEILRANVLLNALPGVTVHEVALADRAGTSRMTNPAHSGAAGLEQLHPAEGTAFEVPTQTLDEVTAGLERIRLIKVDCEGGEILVFRGATSTLQRRAVECYVVEYHPQIIGAAACREIDGRLRTAGYECTAVDGLWVYHLPAVLPDLQGIGPTAVVPPV